MKKLVCLFVLWVIMMFPAHAHPGRTDSNGGHYNRSTGEYHYHHGYQAHQHENGVCQYDSKAGSYIADDSENDSVASGYESSYIYKIEPAEKINPMFFIAFIITFVLVIVAL